MIRELGRFHDNESLIARVQNWPGKLALWAVASALLLWYSVTPLMPVSLALVMLFPPRRRLWLSLAAVGVALQKILRWHENGNATDWLSLEAVAALPWQMLGAGTVAVVMMLYAVYFVVYHLDRLPAIVRRFPLLSIHTCLWVGLFLSTLPGLGVLQLAPGLAWRISYMVTQAGHGKIKGTGFLDHLFYLVPVFGGTATPIGKGLVYLSRSESSDAAEMAQSQLAAMKLLFLVVIWSGVLAVMDLVVFGKGGGWSPLWLEGWSLDAPRLREVLAGNSNPSIGITWAIIYLELIRDVLVLAVTGHLVVGCLRLLGFRVFRNTYKPLLAESIVDFWGRYYYYFKELLVEFFFYPTYMRCAWAGQRLRLLLAVMAAACLGNMYFHIMVENEALLALDLFTFWTTWESRIVYCVLLAIGIWISMLRQQSRRAQPVEAGPVLKMRRIAGVWTFFAVIQIWNINLPKADMLERLSFLLSMVGLL